MISAAERVLVYYSGKGFTNLVSEWDDFELETRHDYIQFAFPTMESSSCLKTAPVLTETDVAAVRDNAIFVERQSRAYARMLKFYTAREHWRAGVPDHNHLRITRMIKSAKLFQNPGYADYVYHSIMALAFNPALRLKEESVPLVARTHWTEALKYGE